MIAEAFDTLFSLGWAALAWLVAVSLIATITVHAVAATVWLVGRAVWKAALAVRKRLSGPSWARGPLRARILARTRARAPQRRTEPYDYEEAA